ncbi:phosphotransferase family protein [Chenggangzhangella methanolivorans]|uniref:Phosphotransferase n=1 Tax=Chenggangzhangella methanolivorans TaxID=1437009 RepID=A0A9E6UJX1_9HYPH|nr:phosphotransferase [Chenggangzhangella methanolivorans]QZN98576.1 phosphotransferase [Chenggangzhangella methanolivorans]
MTGLEERVGAAVARLPGLGEIAGFELAAAPVASPTHRATVSDCVRLDPRDASPVFLKIRHADCAADVSPVAAEAAARAAEAGVAPNVVATAEGALATEFLAPLWRYARVGDLQDVELLSETLAAKRRLHAASPIGWRFDPFERVRALAAEAAALGAPLPDGAAEMAAACDLAGAAIAAAGVDLAFCHNDGVASNVMLRDGPAGDRVRLVDFDLAGDNDPWFDVGALINEACRFEAERRAAIEAYAGACVERIYNRCRLYGAVDDVMWGLWGIVRAVGSKRPGIEFYKYGTWRLSHARATLGERGFEEWLRRL